MIVAAWRLGLAAAVAIAAARCLAGCAAGDDAAWPSPCDPPDAGSDGRAREAIDAPAPIRREAIDAPAVAPSEECDIWCRLNSGGAHGAAVGPESKLK